MDDDLFPDLLPNPPQGEYRDPSKNWKGNTFDGAVYEEEKDVVRLSGQIERVHTILAQSKDVWLTVSEIQIKIANEFLLDDPECSISAQIRNLRKERFGGYMIEKQRRGSEDSAIWEYQLQPENGPIV